VGLRRARLERLERYLGLNGREPGEYDVAQYEDADEVALWFEELLAEFGFGDATEEERSGFLDRFVNGAPGEVLPTPPDHRADA